MSNNDAKFYITFITTYNLVFKNVHQTITCECVMKQLSAFISRTKIFGLHTDLMYLTSLINESRVRFILNFFNEKTYRIGRTLSKKFTGKLALVRNAESILILYTTYNT